MMRLFYLFFSQDSMHLQWCLTPRQLKKKKITHANIKTKKHFLFLFFFFFSFLVQLNLLTDFPKMAQLFTHALDPIAATFDGTPFDLAGDAHGSPTL